MILEAEKSIKQTIERLTKEAFEVFNLENPKPGIDLLIEAYNALPSPRTNYTESFNLLKYIAIGFFRAGWIDESEKWLGDFLEADFNIMRYGESDYLAGKIALKRNHEELAIRHFIVANEKSEGRVFNGNTEDDKANYAFFKTHAKTHVRPKELNEIIEVAIEEIKKQNFRYARSLMFDAFNQDLTNPVVHFHKGLCHFELDELDRAADSFTRAYMLEGEDIFKNQDSKYFDFLKTKIKL